MQLHDLLKTFDPRLPLSGLPDVTVTGICEDSRQASPGVVFVAKAGTRTDGGAFIADARARGAVAVVVGERRADCALPQIVVPDPGAAASVLAHVFHSRPCRAMRVLGVTGTNGKTTTTYLIRHLLSRAGQRCGMVGTVEIDDGRSRREATMTTPGAVELAGLLASMRDKGCRGVAMEVSSHALHQGRAAGIDFSGAAFTNLTGDHLDYHGTMENYAAAKARLFELVDPAGVAVVNAEDKWSDRMIQDCAARIMRFGFGAKADYRATGISVTAGGSKFTLHTPDGKADVDMGLIGRHNIENALAAAALVGEVFHQTVAQIAQGLGDAAGAPGRLQSVRCGQPFAVLVDYAHTDDALINVLTALRPLTAGKLRVVFGCGGDRDRTKRPRMAVAAEKHADCLYVTSDNPRTEDPQAILDEIVAGLSRKLGRSICVEIDRRKAIEQALSDAQAGDVVLIAGKGHENYQIIGATKHHFDDTEEATRVLKARAAA